MQILAFGDSITYGSHVKIGWADQLRSFLFDRFHEADPDGYPRMYNLGIPGETTNGLLQRFEAETRARFREKYGIVVLLISCGTNDIATLGTSTEKEVSITTYEHNLRQILDVSRGISDRISLLTSPPVIEGKPNPNQKNRSNIDIRDYNRVLKKLANEYGADVLDLYEEFEKIGPDTLLGVDGIHPNDLGHRAIVTLVSEYLLKQLTLP